MLWTAPTLRHRSAIDWFASKPEQFKEVNLAMADAKIKERMSSLGGVALPGSPEDYGRTIAVDTATWARVVQFSGAKAQ